MIIWRVFGVVFSAILIQSLVNGSANADSWIGRNNPFGDLSTSAAENLARNLYPERLMQDRTDEPIHQSRAEGQQLISSNLLGGIMRMMGLDSGKLGALVINGLIFLAQMIGKSLAARMFSAAAPHDPPTQPPPPQMGNFPMDDSQAAESFNHHKYEYRSTDEPKVSQGTDETPRSGSPLDWILTNPSPHLNKLMNDARDRNLPQRLVELVTGGQSSKWTEGECILRLLCKSSPFVWAMQRVIGDRIDGVDQQENETQNGSLLETIMKNLPDAKEFDLHGDACEERYPNCRVYT
ncbi:uncharacterized protein LOC129793859 [Lutzomyia longipalpis]|uniref:uncharacterized protein LOC129793859 n=1 Tax=Lutzomyia longipalpis TaxID=7200 RepID=UPI00248351A5|nr:uncharacterized protein LOC129793859 [Lutzomyia longipalpis]